MPEVTVDVAGRSYRLGCGEGEEQHLASLAMLVDAEASRLGRSLGQVSEGRLMLMSALLLADKLSEATAAAEAATAAIEAAERRAAEAEQLAHSRLAPDDVLDPERETEIAHGVDALAERVEALASRLDGAA